MKSLLIAISMAVAAATVAFSPLDADARRLGGGRNAGLQRQAPAPAKQAENPAPPANSTAPTNTAPVAGAAALAAAGAAAANAGRRSWLGPITGLAAGLGIAALASHFGFGETLANVMTLLLLALVAGFAIRWLMRRFAAAPQGGMRLAGVPRSDHAARTPLQPLPGASPTASPREPDALPAGFDAQEFERLAKMVFIRMQAANDTGDVDDLRKFTTPELFASLRVDLHDRAGAAQRTDVLQLHAQVLDSARDEGQWVVSVRFHGLIREQSDAGAQPFDEVWHLVKPTDGSREWAIAGITQAA